MKILTKAFTIMTTLALMACGGGGDGDSGGNSGGGGGTPGGGATLPVKRASRSLAFPGADGGGKNIKGGAEGEVYVVTNLNDSGEGSLRWGLDGSNRTIVFAVAGNIELKTALNIEKSNITVAGQTAPGGGITLKNCPVYVTGSNIILRFLRFRMGDQSKSSFSISGETVTPDPDPLGVKGCKDILIDHCSVSWSIDECASFSNVTNFTLQYCIISESLNHAWHPKGDHGYGGIWGGKNASYHHNLLAHHNSRVPRFDHSYVAKGFRGPIDYVNNIAYNWGGNSTYGGESNTEQGISLPFQINMENNYYKAGPSSSGNVRNRLMELTSYCTNCISGGLATPSKLYISGNIINGNAATWDNVDKEHSTGETRSEADLKAMAKSDTKLTTGYGGATLNQLSFTQSATDAYNSVLEFAGASKSRDAVDVRIVNDVKNGTGKLINSVSDTPGYPELAAGTPITDTDRDGMPDDWEIAQMAALGVTGLGIDAFAPSAYNLSTKYTNLEVYMNELVSGCFPAGANAGSTR